MAKFKIKSTDKKDNSHPYIKIKLREKMIEYEENIVCLDVYGGFGLMYQKIWSRENIEYNSTVGDSLTWLNENNLDKYNVFDIDPYSSPFEAIEIICTKTTQNNIIIICTDGYLRRMGLMRMKLNKFICNKTGWADRDLTLLAAIYHQYPSFLRFLLSKIIKDFTIDKLYIKYGEGTWKQATVYFAIKLKR